MFGKYELATAPVVLPKSYGSLVFTVFFLSAVNASYDQCAAADKENCKPQCHLAVISGLGGFVRIGRSFTGGRRTAAVLFTENIIRTAVCGKGYRTVFHIG